MHRLDHNWSSRSDKPVCSSEVKAEHDADDASQCVLQVPLMVDPMQVKHELRLEVRLLLY